MCAASLQPGQHLVEEKLTFSTTDTYFTTCLGSEVLKFVGQTKISHSPLWLKLRIITWYILLAGETIIIPVLYDVTRQYPRDEHFFAIADEHFFAIAR